VTIRIRPTAKFPKPKKVHPGKSGAIPLLTVALLTCAYARRLIVVAMALALLVMVARTVMVVAGVARVVVVVGPAAAITVVVVAALRFESA
jgi:hypothetical protein